MAKKFELSNVSQDYLSDYYFILDKMMHGMTEAKQTDSISRNFILQMIPHHQAAIEMSRNILKYTTNLSLQDIASLIVEEQTQSIERMKSIEHTCGMLKNSQNDLFLYKHKMNHIMEIMFKNMKTACISNHINCDFMREMIPHHQGAVDMSQTTLQFCICAELSPILRAIIISQKKGIHQMRQLMCCLGCLGQ